METLKVHLRLENIQKPSGFMMAPLAPEQYGWMLCKGFVHSDQKEFYQYIKQLSNIYLQNLLIDNISSFLAIHHINDSVDLYVNNLPIKFRAIVKRDVGIGEVAKIKDIADIDELMFDGIEIKEDDCIVFCFKQEWKFGLFFDFLPSQKDHKLDVNNLYHELGKYYKYLMFQSTYAVLENSPQFEILFKDGWFPFTQIIGRDYEVLAEYYQDKSKFVSNIEKFINSFDKNLIMSFVSNWWRNPIFGEKKHIIMAGLESYFNKNFVSSIKTLYSEIEGIVRMSYVKETNNPKPSFPQLMQYVAQKAKDKFVSPSSLGFPNLFFRYLNEVIFKGFDLETGNINLSRHSISHGVARSEDYTQEKALQAILVLDQIYSYLT